MTPVKQTIEGENGNCFTACVASLFDKPLSDVPNFIEFGVNWWGEFTRFVLDQGGEVEGLIKPRNYPSDELWNEFDGYMIVGGGSPRGISNGHAVIYRYGEPFFDPHPSNDFLTEVEEYYIITKKRKDD